PSSSILPRISLSHGAILRHDMVYQTMMRKTAKQARHLDALQGSRAGLEFSINAEYYIPGMIELQKNKLVWNWNGDKKRVTRCTGLLSGFVGLHNHSETALPERAFRFAKEWGNLFICPRHQGPGAPPQYLASDLFCLNRHPKGHAEDIELWHRMSQKIDGALR